MVATPPHWCKIPVSVEQEVKLFLGENTTAEQIKAFTIPQKSDLRNFEQCYRYDINIEQV